MLLDEEQVDEAESVAAGEYTIPRGTLVMTAPIVFGRLHVVPVVNEFLATFAQINVQLTLSDQTLNLVDEHVDMAVRVGTLPDSTLIATKVGEIRRVVCGSPAYFAAHGTPKTSALTTPSVATLRSCCQYWNGFVPGLALQSVSSEP
jgi:DNA-binding transcriptional LysR family regulator